MALHNIDLGQLLSIQQPHYHVPSVDTEIDSHPLCRHKTCVEIQDGKYIAKTKYFPIEEEITAFLQSHGYTITGLLARSGADVFTAVKEGKEYAVVLNNQAEASTEDMYDSLVGETLPHLANVYLHQVIGITSVLVEEKAVVTLEQYCRQIVDKNPADKVAFVRLVYAWSITAEGRMEKEGLAHTDPTISNVGLFEEDGQFKLKYIDLASLVQFTDMGYTLSSFEMDAMLSILFD